MCWDLIPPVAGTYLPTGQTGAASRQVAISIDLDFELPTPEVNQAIVATGSVQIHWTADSTARSFLVRIDPIPYRGVVLAEIVVPSRLRTWTFDLDLPPGNYQAGVWAFSDDFAGSAPLQPRFEVASDSLVFTNP
jgi:hypothetical protein